MSISEDFRCLSNKDPGTWLPIPRLCVLFVILVGVVVLGVVLFLRPQQEELVSAKAEEEKLKEEFVASKQEAVNLEPYRQQLQDIETSFGTLLKQLPDRTEVDALLQEVNQAGMGQGLQFDLFKPGPERNKDFYAELPVDVKINGRYHEFGSFAADIAKLSRIVTLNDIKIVPGQGGSLVMTMQLKTFRYLDGSVGQSAGGGK
jgi:type IV pilus assembly protein PilO